MLAKLNHTSGKFRSFDGTAIFYNCCQPAEEARGVIFLLHGLSEHSGRYDNFVQHFVPLGFTVFAMDLRGHGQSQGKRGCIRHFEEYIKDLHRFRCYFSQSFEGKPNFIFGHSLGGLIAFSYSLTHSDDLNGLILASPLFGMSLKIPPLKQFLGKLLSAIMPTLCMNNEIIPLHLCHESKVVDAYCNDPLIHDRVSTRLFTEILAAIKNVSNAANRSTVPMLFCLAGDDRLVCVDSSKKIFKKVGSSDKQIIIYENFYHELCNEPDYPRVMKDIENWLLTKTG